MLLNQDFKMQSTDTNIEITQAFIKKTTLHDFVSLSQSGEISTNIETLRTSDFKYMSKLPLTAMLSTSRRNKVASLVVKDGHILSTGFNRPPDNFHPACDFERVLSDEEMEKYQIKGKDRFTTHLYTIHAEAIALFDADNDDTLNSHVYVSLSPCLECCKLIIQKGVKRVVFGEMYRFPSHLWYLVQAGIEIVYIKQNYMDKRTLDVIN